jgi:Protein of unknown function (DUF2452)
MAKSKKTPKEPVRQTNEKAKEPEQAPFVNPIDKDKVAENPGLLPYAHSVSGAVIRVEDKGQIRGNALVAMYDQTDRQMDQLRDQMETLMNQARELKNRKEVSEMIYRADLHFAPVIHHTYHLYQRENATCTLSLVAPNEWGRKKPFKFCATVRLLGDHTWEINAMADDFEV